MNVIALLFGILMIMLGILIILYRIELIQSRDKFFEEYLNIKLAFTSGTRKLQLVFFGVAVIVSGIIILLKSLGPFAFSILGE